MSQPAEQHHVQRIETLLRQHGFEHLRARKYGRAVIVESGPSQDPIKHLRVCRQSAQRWRLEFANQRGKWEATPLDGTVDELVTAVVQQFPWTIQNIE